MLKLEKLELRGFKSFCDLTELYLTDTLTAVVGPNGCGKSNIADSITWVLGEQSARSLRGGKMEDVIFQGTRTRQPVGMAEVVLTFVAQQDLSAQNGEVGHGGGETDETQERGKSNGFHLTVASGERITIGRRLYRSGESEYLINGRRVRLRDINDLFSGTGLGPGHYAIIGQGNVGEIITAKPFERRAVVEAAAGITRFRLRQRSIELRLQSAKQNLTRVDDIISELDRQVRSLKRQAAKARRYRRFKEELRGLLRVWYAAEADRIESELAQVSDLLEEATRVHSEVTGAVTLREGEYRLALDATRKQEALVNEGRDQLNFVELQLERTRSQQAGCEGHISNLELKRTELDRDRRRLQERITRASEELLRSRSDLDRITRAVGDAQMLLVESESRHRDELACLRSAEQSLESLRQQLLEKANHHANLRHASQQIDVDIEREKKRRNGLHAERERARVKHNDLERLFTELSESVGRDRDRLQELAGQLSRMEARFRELQTQHTKQNQELESIERERLTTEERLGLLTELDRQHAYCSPAVQRLFNEGGQERRARLIGTLADIVHVKRDHERIVEAMMGDRLQTILVPTVEDAVASIAFLDQTRSGQGAFMVVGFQGAQQAPEMGTEDPERNDHAQPAGCEGTSFVEILNLNAGQAEVFRRAYPEVASALVVSDLETAIELAFQERTRLFVTPEGHYVRGGHLIVGGSETDGVKSVLATKREIQELAERHETIRQSADSARIGVIEMERELAEMNQELGRLRMVHQTEEKAVIERTAQLTGIENDRNRADQHVRVIDLELIQVDMDLEELDTRRDRLIGSLRQAEAELGNCRNDCEGAQAALASVREHAESSMEHLSAQRSEVAATLERQRSLQADQDRLAREESGLTQELGNNREESVRLEQEIVGLQATLSTVAQQLTDLEAERVTAQERVEQASRHLEELYEQVDTINASLDQQRVEERLARERISQLEVHRAQRMSDARHLRESCHNELAQSLEEVVTLAETGENSVETQVSLTDAEAVKERIQGLREGLEMMGPVNMVALEDLQSQQERLEFMLDQRGDVLQSIISTERALEEIKRRSRKRFIDAFEQINNHFGDVFVELFGGGQGRMVLLDEENPLESGIDIIAQPPGKRLQNMMLLSGGEKSMTAIALLLAIFRYRPSPFCLLDEVDAQLDEVNIRRFARKIEEMSGQTQFILITHNKTTMQAAQSLHGVTMEEPGISRLVSVKLK